MSLYEVLLWFLFWVGILALLLFGGAALVIAVKEFVKWLQHKRRGTL